MIDICIYVITNQLHFLKLLPQQLLIQWYCEAFQYAVFTYDSLSYFVVKVLSVLS